MLALLFNLSVGEIGMLLVVAILVFGRRLPEVAGQAAATLQKLRRNLNELRRETGIDEEFRSAQRTIRESVKLDLETQDVGHDLLNQAGLDPETRNILARPLDDPSSGTHTIDAEATAVGQFSRDPHDPTLPSADRREPDAATEDSEDPGEETEDDEMPLEERLRSQGLDPTETSTDPVEDSDLETNQGSEKSRPTESG